METANPLGVAVIMAMQKLLPVGSIIEWCPVDGGPDLSTPDKVAAYYGFGRWEAFGTSQATVGTDKLHAPGTTWGNREITLNAANMPTTLPLSYGDSRSGGRTVIDANAVLQQATRHDTAQINANVNGAEPINIEGPSIAVYRWRRLA